MTDRIIIPCGRYFSYLLICHTVKQKHIPANGSIHAVYSRIHKHAIAAVNFHSKSRQMITHEMWARLILFNFCSYITGQVTFKEQKRRHAHQVDFSLAFKTCRHFLRLHLGEARRMWKA